MTPARVGALVGLAVALVVLGPALAPGYLLSYDMVFVPHLALGARTLGIDGSVPRAVPTDAVVALVSTVVPGWVVQKLLLVLVFVGVGSGVARLMRSRVGATVAAVAACWNPYVGERLAIGHWSFLLGYAVLPWLADAAAACRDGRVGARSRLAFWMLLGALTGSTGAVVGFVVAMAVLVWPTERARGRRRSARVVDVVVLTVTAAAVNAPWWVPFLAGSAADPADPAGVTAFAARSDSSLGVVGSVLTLGGMWNQGVWFAERRTWVVGLAALAMVLGVLVVALRQRSWWSHPVCPGLLVAGTGCLVLALAGAVPGSTHLMQVLVMHVPGAGLLRDGQKFVAAWALVVALAAGFAAEVGSAALAARELRPARVVLLLVLVLWPVAVLPGLAFGDSGRWRSVDYPSTMLSTAATLDAAPAGAVAVFPWTYYRRYAWNGDRVVLDPWQRLLARRTLLNDDLPLAEGTVQGEDPDAQAVSDALGSGRDLAASLRGLGVRYVLVLTDQPRVERALSTLEHGRVLVDSPGERVVDLGPVADRSHRVTAAGWWVGLAGAGAVLVWRITDVGSRTRRGRGSVGTLDAFEKETMS